jgi:transcriptional regulator with XRE-family HTH domain
VIAGRTLRVARTHAGMTQAALAARAGISQVSIATFETGKSDMKSSTLGKVLGVLGVSVELVLHDQTRIRAGQGS